MRQVIKILLTVMLVVGGQSASAQTNLLADTMHIDEVIVKTEKTSGENGYRKTEIYANNLTITGPLNIADVIERYTSLAVRQYGPGGLSMISFRGMDPVHTKVSWEGIELNQSMTGQFDLSRIAAGLADRLVIVHGQSGETGTASGPGGSVLLSSTPDWSGSSGMTLNMSRDRFGITDGRAGLVISTGNVSYKVNSNYQGGKNNYIYSGSNNDTGNPALRRENAGYRDNSISQYLAVRHNNNVFALKSVYIKSDRSLPGSLSGSYAGSQSQFNESMITSASIDNYRKHSKIFVKAGWVSDWMNYTNSQVSIDSRNKSERMALVGGWELNGSDNKRLNITLSEYYDRVKSSNYGHLQDRNRINIGVTYTDGIGYLFNYNIKSVAVIVDSHILTPDINAGFEYMIRPGSPFSINGNFGRSTTLPPLNSLYWVPGGNAELEPEIVNSSELSVVNKIEGTHFESATELVFFYNMMNNLIKWRPGDEGYWEAMNISKASSLGYEASSGINIKRGKHLLSSKVSYTFTQAQNKSVSGENDKSYGKQLIYVPKHEVRMWIDWVSGDISFGADGQFVSGRYTTTDNSLSLPAFLTINSCAGYTFRVSRVLSFVGINITNIFNKEYEYIAGYPLPLRSFRITFKFNYQGK